MITGSTDGIGEKTALEMVKQGYHVIVHGRNLKKAENTIKRIREKSNKGSLTPVYADLNSFEQIENMADDLHNHFDKLDILINNAGVFKPQREVNQENLEVTFAVNYVAPFFLTNLVIDLLRKPKSAKIVNVVSQVHSNHLDFQNLQHERGYSGTKAYALSKTCLIMFTYVLADKLQDADITVNCLHPGVINTKLLQSAMGSFGASPSEGVDAILYVATSSDVENMTGKYFKNNKPQRSKDITYNKETQQKLWEKTEQLIGRDFNWYKR